MPHPKFSFPMSRPKPKTRWIFEPPTLMLTLMALFAFSLLSIFVIHFYPITPIADAAASPKTAAINSSLPLPDVEPSLDRLEPEVETPSAISPDRVAPAETRPEPLLSSDAPLPRSSHFLYDHALSSSEIAVVDIKRLFAEHPPESATQEAREETLRKIQRTINTFATTHRLSLVLDRSGATLNGVPDVLYARGFFDITEEISHQLAQE